MEKIRRLVILTIAALFIFTFTVLASEGGIKISELIDKGKEYDNKVITLEGEAIGELLERGENSFVNINDGSSAMGIYLKTIEGETIEYYGDYHNIGDRVKVEGVFHRACEEHGGDMDVHSNTIEIISKGYEVTHEIDRWKVILIVFLAPGVFLAGIQVYDIIRKNPKAENNGIS